MTRQTIRNPPDDVQLGVVRSVTDKNVYVSRSGVEGSGDEEGFGGGEADMFAP